MKNIYPLIIECARVEPDFDRIVSLATQQIDWNRTVKFAYAHGIFPLLAKNLKYIPNVPMDVQKIVKLTNIDIAQHNLQATGELMRVISLLRDHGIDVITFKGPVLSQMAYGDIVSRQYGDLDILVERGDLAKVGTLLCDAGFVNLLPLSILNNQTCLNIIKDFTFVHEKSGVTIELHWKLFEKKYGIDLFNQNEIQTIRINNRIVRTIEDEILLVYLCLHGSKHMWERLEWVCDIDRLIRNRTYDWDKVISYALLFRQVDGVFLGFALCRDLFNTELPDRLQSYINTTRINRLINTIYFAIENNLFEQNDFKRNKMIFLFQVKMMNNVWDKISFFSNIIFKISPEDCQTFHISDKWSYLYVILRPYRLIKVYINKKLLRQK